MTIELLPHNKKASDAAKRMLEENGKAAVIHPTGTGKTSIAVDIMLDNPTARILYLTSTYQVLNGFSKNLKDYGIDKSVLPNLKGQIYSNLLSLSEEELQNKFDLIILDEFHRCGAKEWNKAVKKLLASNPNAKVLGLTATPIRFLDNERDMAFELFEGNIASIMSLPEALVEGIIPVPTYLNMLISFNKDINTLTNRIEKIKNNATKERAINRLTKLKRSISNVPTLDELFSRHITKKDGKFLIFCKDIEHLEEVKKSIGDLFGRVNDRITVYEVNYKRSDNVDTVSRFGSNDDDSLKILLTVDMLNEGVHIKDLDGVIMMRRTVSPILFLQQLGRALSVNSSKPLVFDVVDNLRSTENIYDLYQEFERLEAVYEDAIIDSDLTLVEKKLKIKKLREIKGEFEIIDEMQEIKSMINDLNKFIGFGFDEYYEYLAIYYELNGNIDIPRSYVVDGISLGNWLVKCRTLKKSGNLTEKQIEMLDKLGMIWNKNDEAFTIGYEYAAAYYEEYKNLLVPVTYVVNDFSLGIFIRKLRNSYKKGKLSVERIKLMEDIGMIWDVRHHQFMEGYKLLKEYYDTHGNLDIPKGYRVDGIDLGIWLKNRNSTSGKKALTKKEAKLLADLGVKSLRDIWQENYDVAASYYKEHQNLDVIKNDNPELYIWLANQRDRYQKGTLFPERKELLDKIGMIWDLQDYRFRQGYGYAAAFYEKFKTWEIPKDYVVLENPEFNLAAWAIERRKNKRRLKEHQIKLLDDINFDWNPYETKWLKGYSYAVKYYLEFRNLLVPNGFVYQGYNLGNFINSNRKAYRDGKLSEERIMKLELIGMVWSVKEMTDKDEIKQDVVWKDKLSIYYLAKTNGEEMSPEILIWKEQVLEDFKNHLLSEEQVNLIYAFGLISDKDYTDYVGEDNTLDVPKL